MPAFALVVALLGAWEAYVRVRGIDELLLPAPTAIATSLWEDADLLMPDLWVTTGETLLGLAVAVVLGAALAVIMHLVKPIRRAVHPLVVGSQAIPIVVIAAPLIMLLGFGLAPKVVVVALVCFFPVTIALYNGLLSPEPDQARLLRALHATRWQTLRHLDAPAALPQAFTGLKIAAAVSVIGAVFAEWTGSSEGLGHLLITAGGQLETARQFAATVLLFALAIALYGAVALAERRLVTWNDPGGS
jgi:NitT/TauT family transport system permease protein/putative hydroxymethylpyrimidine transport system permease protein